MEKYQILQIKLTGSVLKLLNKKPGGWEKETKVKHLHFKNCIKQDMGNTMPLFAF